MRAGADKRPSAAKVRDGRRQPSAAITGKPTGGRDWIRTSVAARREIYSLVDLTTLPPFQGQSRRLDADADETETEPGLTWERVL